MSNSRIKGNKGLSVAIAYFGSNEYVVSVPLTDTQDYDLIVDNGILQKVQVKYINYKNKANNYHVGLRVISGSTRKVVKIGDECVYDLLFVVCSNKNMYLIPKSQIKNKNSIVLTPDKDKYKVYL